MSPITICGRGSIVHITINGQNLKAAGGLQKEGQASHPYNTKALAAEQAGSPLGASLTAVQSRHRLPSCACPFFRPSWSGRATIFAEKRWFTITTTQLWRLVRSPPRTTSHLKGHWRTTFLFETSYVCKSKTLPRSAQDRSDNFSVHIGQTDNRQVVCH